TLELARTLLPASVSERVAGPALAVLGRLFPRSRFVRLLQGPGERIEERYLGVSFFDTALVDQLFLPWVRKRLGPRGALALVRRLQAESGGPEVVAKMAAVDCRSWLVENTLLRSDAFSMAASIELRVPFLDHRLVELGARIPARFKVQPYGQKL